MFLLLCFRKGYLRYPIITNLRQNGEGGRRVVLGGPESPDDTTVVLSSWRGAQQTPRPPHCRKFSGGQAPELRTSENP